MSALQPAPPDWLRVLWRGSAVIALVAFFAVSAMVMRALVGGFGPAVWPLALACLGALLSGLLLVPAASLVELPEAMYSHWLPERRVVKGGCPECGYSALHTPVARCPECGAKLCATTPYAITLRTLRRGLKLALPAWIAGCALGLVLVLRDEHSFTVEITAKRNRAPDAVIFTRQRAGAAKFATLQWTAADGFEGPPPFRSAKEANWKPAPTP